LREQLDRLIDEMLTKGILYDDAKREIERRFITRALARSQGNLGQAASLLGIHRNTLTRKVTSYRLKKHRRTG
jgi:DNA-binding NtrC family response regulator